MAGSQCVLVATRLQIYFLIWKVGMSVIESAGEQVSQLCGQKLI